MVNLTERLLQAILTSPLFLLAYQSVPRTTKRRRDSISLETLMSILTILVSVQGTSKSSFIDALLGLTYTTRIATASSTWEKMALAKKDVRGTLVYEETPLTSTLDAVVDSYCQQVAGTITSNVCLDALFGCSGPPIQIITLWYNGQE